MDVLLRELVNLPLPVPNYLSGDADEVSGGDLFELDDFTLGDIHLDLGPDGHIRML